MKTIAAAFALAMFVSACGTREPLGQDDTIETRTSEISGITTWHQNMPPLPIPGILVGAGPSFAYNGSHWVAAVQVNNQQVCTTYDNPAGSGTWHSPWDCSHPPQDVFPGALASITNLPNGKFLVLVTGAGDQQIWSQVQDYKGSVDIDTGWIVIQPGALFRESPAVALNILPAVGNSSPTLMIVAQGLDGHIYSSRNILTGSLYSPSHWEAFALLPGTNTYKYSPAIAMVCTSLRTSASFIAAGLNAADSTYNYMLFNGTSFGTPLQVQNGLFDTSPALACAGTGTNSELSIWGIGLGPSFQLYYSTQLSGGPAGFTLASTTNLGHFLPTARGTTTNKVKVGVIVGGLPAHADANSP